jgi:pSer/pThr/pTyr-binding forkhead associated (FHA) protein
MIETILLVGRMLLVALLFLFLYTVMRTGVGQVRGQSRGSHWTVSVSKGPKEINGLKVAVTTPVVVGRASGADILVNAEFVSGRHARFTPIDERLVVEDLGSTNGTMVNNRAINEPYELFDGDSIQIGDVVLQVQHL